MSPRFYIAAAVVVALLQSGALASMIYDRAQRITTGRDVVLESRMRDPRDLFRGHFVTLNLDVGELRTDQVPVDRAFTRNETVFVELEEGDGPFWRARKLWHEIPATAEGVFLKARMQTTPLSGISFYRISFPFDRYFAPKERALEIENIRSDGMLGVILAVSNDGTGYIKGLSIDGKRIYDEPLY
jgi:uncharacterized membrane-anchored protein